MYKLIKVINNLKHSYIVHNNNLFYSTKNDELIIENINTNKILYNKNIKSSKLGIVFSKYHFSDVNNLHSNILDFENDKIFELDYLIMESNNKKIIAKQRIDRIKLTLLINQNFEVIDRLGDNLGKNRFLVKEFFIFNPYLNDTLLKCYNLNHPEKPLWQFNLSQFGTYYYIGDNLAYEVVQFIGIWNNLLLVQLTNARLIALDIETGALKKDLEINKTNPLETPLFYDQYTKMHLVGDKIIWLSNQTLIHIDLHTFKAEIIKEFYSKPREEQWRFMHNTYFEGKIYFTADYAWQYVTPTHIGVMDANTGEVLWSTQLKNTGGLPEAPKITKDKLYIRTSTAMLHIFEKQADETT